MNEGMRSDFSNTISLECGLSHSEILSHTFNATLPSDGHPHALERREESPELGLDPSVLPPLRMSILIPKVLPLLCTHVFQLSKYANLRGHLHATEAVQDLSASPHQYEVIAHLPVTMHDAQLLAGH